MEKLEGVISQKEKLEKDAKLEQDKYQEQIKESQI